MSHVDQIKNVLNVEDVVSSYIKIEKAGSNFRASCPFHNEKTPSFFISPSRQSYYCFGCGAKGDIFTFVEAFEGLDFMGALKVLAERAGVSLGGLDFKSRGEKERLYQCLEDASAFYMDALSSSQDHSVEEYLKKRGVDKSIISEWNIGYAPLDWHRAHDVLKKKGYTDSEIERAGIIKKAADDNTGRVRYYDRFRGRIMFPINDSGGRVIGFSGRIFQDDGKSAKYLNSPETELFVKSKILFGLDKAKTSIREKRSIVLAEGQMDVIMSRAAGIGNTVGLSGTAFTEDHAGLLKRFADTLVLAFDSDRAGINATQRSAAIALAAGLDVKVAVIPEGLDPADFALKHPEKWQKAVSVPVHIVDFALNDILSSNEKGKKIIQGVHEFVFPLVRSMKSAMERSTYLKMIASRTGIKEEAVIEDFGKSEKSASAESKKQHLVEAAKEDAALDAHRLMVEKRIYGIMTWQESLESPVVDPAGIKQRLEAVVGKKGVQDLMSRLDAVKDELVLRAEVMHGRENVEEELNELFVNFESDYLKEELRAAVENLSEAERSADKEKMKETLEKCGQLSARLAKLTKN
ncbi:MAG: DNA primase [Candidatus Taylorbacteria bacterium RIFCSPLOWO2_12_FULL_43_20]|uniref:DNA primase n=1 Tax=Candidatus Taylorbacteria bacterium RIFCSPLOWO2_12_FULL_43_20 TaxID=1802332 RepID=A0A1G2P2J8_9BACT|nr:MAG: DNA primase [Candidatus Taylorbacteria bacterium RIFCSPHIGHO2_01_FULL_43_120]OHA23520.1 MAG: DNA primase [Candidatus Taylorbacteria bacterium RIFCSPHIGHO2_02_FULL_43_55]OHA29968.1 MAG: DNA primase [Candidatus Taylorbacteria bacterium RIFCSPHIGHO2_12_FULL_42_34]OHA31667.1 MAG: DNA primase [Candidatus Taylorbacteria bacterium RIFCSPLOWO2_01_FULL_43_83]OHA39166.1 MAG: DNA primase [Candidatus Taylorbacteria bacterium RIFCSPLOWO2_02_FULL_43_22b]OHA42565.1 MAG: DNA primase [Candidatus Taylor